MTLSSKTDIKNGRYRACSGKDWKQKIKEIGWKRNVSPVELAMKVTRPKVMAHAAKICVQWEGLRKLREGLENAGLGREVEVQSYWKGGLRQSHEEFQTQQKTSRLAPVWGQGPGPYLAAWGSYEIKTIFSGGITVCLPKDKTWRGTQL